MNSKRIFSWSKRQSTSDPYYRTGGLLSIDASPEVSSNDFDAKVRIEDSRNHDALAECIDVVAQKEANTRALSEHLQGAVHEDACKCVVVLHDSLTLTNRSRQSLDEVGHPTSRSLRRTISNSA